MATIAVNIPGVPGETTVQGFNNLVAAIGLRETIEVGVRSTGASRGSGSPKHSDFQLIRYKDSSSPKLIQACSAAENLGNVRITIFRTVSVGVVPFMHYILSKVYVSRVEQETLDERHTALGPHLMEQTRGIPTPGPSGITSILAPVVTNALASSRLTVLPLEQTDAFANQEIERVSLNADTVVWAYTPYKNGVAGGVVERGYNLATGSTL